MTKVTVESYQLRVSNASDEARLYDISCTLNVIMARRKPKSVAGYSYLVHTR